MSALTPRASTKPSDHSPQHSAHLSALFARTVARVSTRAALRGAAAGIGVASAWLLLGLASDTIATWSHSWAGRAVPLLLGAISGAAVTWWLSQRDRAQPARVLESVVPASRNLLRTGEELLSGRSTTRVPEGVSELVLERAGKLASTLNVNTLLPLQPAALWLAAAFVAYVVVAFAVDRIAFGTAATPAQSLIAAVTHRVEIQRITARVTPPAYAKRDAVVERNPSRIDALSGSTITVTVSASADSLVVTTRDRTQTLARSSDGTFSLSFPATHDGFLAIEPRNTAGTTGARRLIGVTVRADEAPHVRIAAPAKDIIVPDSKRTLDVRVEADDDLAVGSLRLRYTKVSGSGERFTFSEGEVPVNIARTSSTQWAARAALALEPLLVEPGDLVVYRAVATDSRPGSPPVESDAFIAELAAPGGIASLGFALDPDEDRYAVSQQMVILKTEKLIAKQSTMTAAAIADEAVKIAGEQRRVRAEFVFMMGGELAQETTGDESMSDLDESQEAEGEADLAAGRMANRGRISLLTAVRSMSRAAVALNVANLAPALVQEKNALKQLQEAFARARFLMRALSQREQLDLTRRLTGKLDSTSRERAPVPDGERSAQTKAWRELLSELMTIARTTPVDRSRLSLLAERVLQVDASSKAAQKLSAQLSSASQSATPVRTAQLIDSAATGFTSILRESLRPTAPAETPTELRRLQSVLDASRRSAGRP